MLTSFSHPFNRNGERPLTFPITLIIPKRKPVERYKLYYLPISSYDKFYELIIPRNPVRVLPEDFLMINNETNFDKIYSNGDFDLWLVFSVSQMK